MMEQNKGKLGMGAIDFRYLLLDLYKKLGLHEDEVMVLLMVDQLIREGNEFVQASDLCFKMNYKLEDLDRLLAALLKKDLLRIESSNGRMLTSLSPIKERLYALFQSEVSKQRGNPLSALRAETLGRVREYCERRLNRTISPLEVEAIGSWIDDGYSEDDIKGALELSISSGKKNFKSVDKQLRTMRYRDDVDAEGYSGISGEWGKNIEETIEIAKTKWVDDDD